MSNRTVQGVDDARSSRWFATGLGAGAVAAVVDIIPILLIQGLLLKVGPTRIFQSIASGMTGAAAYAGGLPSAFLGALVHLLISLIAGLAYAYAAARLPLLVRRPVIGGLAYGVLVYLVMSYIVVPMSAVAFKPATDPALIAISLGIHMVAFGLPIALVTRRALGLVGRNSRAVGGAII